MNNPQRCFSCNKIIGNLWEDYEIYKKQAMKFDEICTKLGIERYCCKRMILSNKNFYDKFSKYTDKNLRLITINRESDNYIFHNTK
jgi:DNA-directed RNA polymerase subunit N (RpoN/RPB10)